MGEEAEHEFHVELLSMKYPEISWRNTLIGGEEGGVTPMYSSSDQALKTYVAAFRRRDAEVSCCRVSPHLLSADLLRRVSTLMLIIFASLRRLGTCLIGCVAPWYFMALAWYDTC